MPQLRNEIIVFNRNIPAGVSTILKNIIKHSNHENYLYKLILYTLDQKESHTIKEDWCDNVIRLQLSELDNVYYTLNKLKQHISPKSIIVANDMPELKMCVMLKIKNPLVYIIHGDFEDYYYCCEIFQDYMDTIIAYSSHIALRLKSRLKNENRNKVKLIYYPVASIVAGNNVHNHLHIVFAGSLIHRKGADILPEIVHQLDSFNVRYKLSIVGIGVLEDFLKSDLSHHNNVHFLGQKSHSETLEVFQQSDILLFPTRLEGLPNVLVEAMKAGCIPVISNIESGVPDVIIHGKNGFLIERDDVNAFVQTIVDLSNNNKLRGQLRKNAINTANQMFDPFKNAKMYMEAFINTASKSVLPNLPKPIGPILDQKFLPNFLVRFLRSLRINPNL